MPCLWQTSAPCWQFLAGRAGDCIDLGVAAYLLNPEENDYGWPRLSARWGAVLRHELESRGETAPGPARLGLAMAQLFEQRMEKDGLLELFRRLEMPLLPVLAVGLFSLGLPISAVSPSVWAAELTGPEDFPRAVQVINLAYAVGVILFGPVPGILADRTGSYIPAYLLFAALLTLAVALVRLAYARKKRLTV